MPKRPTRSALRSPTIFSRAAPDGSAARSVHEQRMGESSGRAGPLAGLGVLVTRPARQAGGFAQKLAALGAPPCIFPAIAILPPENPEALARVHAALADYDIAVFVSANAVEYG